MVRNNLEILVPSAKNLKVTAQIEYLTLLIWNKQTFYIIPPHLCRASLLFVTLWCKMFKYGPVVDEFKPFDDQHKFVQNALR